MKKRCYFFVLMLIMGCFALGACTNVQKALPNGMNFPVKGVPSIETFSGSNLEEYEFHFSPIKYAVYHHDMVEEMISADDSRLIRLLNFLAYSMTNDLSIWRQSYVQEDEIMVYFQSDEPMLEVYFQTGQNNSNNAHLNCPRVVICGDSYLLFLDEKVAGDQNADNLCAERYWPYGELVLAMDAENMISFDGWGTGCWIDLLTYAGF